jgi:hypothetical protein
MTRRNGRQTIWWGAAVALLALAVWGQGTRQSAASSGPIEEKTIPLKPSVTFVKASFLTGELRNMKVTEQMERGTGKVAAAPVFRARLTVTNDSTDQAARLLGGKIEYIDPAGNVIVLPHTSFRFIGVPTDRLDPGMHTSQVIEVPFPIAALKGNGLGEVSLELTYLPIPYREDTVNIPVTLGS